MQGLLNTPAGNLLLRGLGAVMESRFRYRFWNPANILRGAGIHAGQHVLELGCGTGFFTLPAGRLIGDQGHLVAMDVLAESTALVSSKARTAGLRNVRVVQGNALATGFAGASFDAILLFGVIPAPMLPMSRLVPELHRVLKSGGTLSVWPPVPGWLPQAILQGDLFVCRGQRGGVYNFVRK